MMFHSMVTGMVLMASISFNMDARSWRSVNDGVMGGVSSGGMSQNGNVLVFAGKLSLENNGGFASVRSLAEQDLTGATRVRIEVRGDGREYQFRIRHKNSFDDVAWRAMFTTQEDWQVIELALDQFVPVFRGRTVAGAGPVVASEIQQIGFLLADRKAGPFKLEIRHIEFLGPKDAAASP
jgi:NADH dehydrogenase [ubiquinone] 1 alpha subcomplex assembly factor 1